MRKEIEPGALPCRAQTRPPPSAWTRTPAKVPDACMVYFSFPNSWVEQIDFIERKKIKYVWISVNTYILLANFFKQLETKIIFPEFNNFSMFWLPFWQFFFEADPQAVRILQK